MCLFLWLCKKAALTSSRWISSFFALMMSAHRTEAILLRSGVLHDVLVLLSIAVCFLLCHILGAHPSTLSHSTITITQNQVGVPFSDPLADGTLSVHPDHFIHPICSPTHPPTSRAYVTLQNASFLCPFCLYVNRHNKAPPSRKQIWYANEVKIVEPVSVKSKNSHTLSYSFTHPPDNSRIHSLAL
jgi:hypothetical protein